MPKPTGEALTQATIRWKEYKNIKIDRIGKAGTCKQALWEVAVSPFLESFMGKCIMCESTGDTQRRNTQ